MKTTNSVEAVSVAMKAITSASTDKHQAIKAAMTITITASLQVIAVAIANISRST